MSSEHSPHHSTTSIRGQRPQVRAVGVALPPNYVEQQVLTHALRDYWIRRYGSAKRLDEFHRAVRVHLALPISDYPALDSFGKTNRAWKTAAVQVGEAHLDRR